MNEERYLLFDQYLQGEMTVEERNSFEREVSENEEFAAEFRTFKEVQVQLQHKFGHVQEREAFKENLSGIADKHFNKEKPKAILMRPWYYVAAASVVILFGLFFFNQSAKPNFEQYNQPEQAHFTERGDLDATLKQAEEAYNAKNYKTAIPLFETALKENRTPEIQYFYGIALLENDQFSKSESVFNELKSGKSVYKEKSLWYLALSKLKQKDYEGSRQILQTISQDYEDYDEVQELLDALN